MFRILEVGTPGIRLYIRDGCLNWEIPTGSAQGGLAIEDLGAVILATPAVSLSGHVLAVLAAAHIPLVSCDTNYQPTGLFEPFQNIGTGHMDLQKRQFALSLPLRKRLWQALIQAKVFKQSQVLLQIRNSNILTLLPETIQSGDTGNVESRAAVLYWRKLALFPRRDRNASDANILFNYAYTILYGITARHLCSAGFHLRLGIRHENKYNPFCLASDVMEPFRPFADQIVMQTLDCLPGDAIPLTPSLRGKLLKGLLDTKIQMQEGELPLTEAIQKTVFSLRKAILECKPKELILPYMRRDKACG